MDDVSRYESLSGQRQQLPALAAGQVDNLLARISRRLNRGQPADKLLEKAELTVSTALALVTRRSERIPELSFPPELPVSAAIDALRDALSRTQVLIVAGETGSGKTTQLPKLCLSMGLGRRGLIGHTQPRRIAARAVAKRLCVETGLQAGEDIAFHTRFEKQLGTDPLVKVMTDGILLSELAGDPDLLRYEALIIDEAHERSLNIDFLLGYTRELVKRRPDFKLIITSATMDTVRLAEWYGRAEALSVEGRGYPVDIRYQPPADGESMPQSVVKAVEALDVEPGRRRGDVLVFLPTEAAIRETAVALRRCGIAGLDVLPLYGRLPAAEQDRIFSRGDGRWRVVLATNVAETSLTVPGIAFVIDTGSARMARYSPRSKLQRLPVEPVSQASAAQRAGRCGRIGPGVAVRLYSEADFQGRAAFTEPEIQRSNLAAVILRMAADRLGDVRRFPFIDPPDSRQIRDGYKTLEEIGAMDGDQLTATGRRLARLPVDPRIGRVVLAAAELGCLREMSVIAAALAVQDPREWPADKREQAQQHHARFRHEESEFLGDWQLWCHLESQREALSNNGFKRYCQSTFLSPARVREWREVHRQLLLSLKRLGLAGNNPPANYPQVHQALLHGFLSGIGTHHSDGEYLGAANRRFHVFPGALLKKKRPRWLLAAELVETRRVYARRVARIDPEWVMAIRPGLLKHEYAEPRYSARRGRVMASRNTRLFGLMLEQGKRVDFAAIHPEEARECFIRQALVEGLYRGKESFYRTNRQLLTEMEALEERQRRRDVAPAEDAVFEHYDQTLPPDVCSDATLRRWWKKAGPGDQQALQLDAASFKKRWQSHLPQFPESLSSAGVNLPLSYRFEPGHEADGVSVTLPMRWLPRVQQDDFERLVPGMLPDKLEQLLRALPKSARRPLVPIPATVQRLLPLISSRGPLLNGVAAALAQLGLPVPDPADWHPELLDDWYRMRFVIVENDGEVLGSGRDLPLLQARFADRVDQDLKQEQRSPLPALSGTRWLFGDLPETVSYSEQGTRATIWPALEDGRDTVNLVPSLTAAEAQRVSRAGLARLLLFAQHSASRRWRRELLAGNQVQLLFKGTGGDRAAWVDQLLMTAAADCRDLWLQPVRDEQDFRRCVEAVSEVLPARVSALAALLEQLLTDRRHLERELSALSDPSLYPAAADIRRHLNRLLVPDVLWATPAEQRERLPVYVEAARRRVNSLRGNAARERQQTALLESLETPFFTWLETVPAIRELPEEVQQFRWRLEELRVSLFAQDLGAVGPVSEKRLRRELRALQESRLPEA